MFAADLVTPLITTDGTPTPTGTLGRQAAAAFAARDTVRAIDVTILAGVDGVGVATRSRGEISSPFATSTTPTLIPLPPTSTPIATVGPSSVRMSVVIEAAP